jgi:hypothetical protein
MALLISNSRAQGQIIVKNPVFYLYYIVLALWVGGIALFTFIITPAIFSSYSRDMAGEIVSRLFPGYFLYNLILSLLALILFFISWRVVSDIQKGFRLSLYCIVIAVVVNVFVCFKLHPEIIAIKKELHSFETVSRDDPLRMKFRSLHGISAVLNLLLLADGVTLLLFGTVIKK